MTSPLVRLFALLLSAPFAACALSPPTGDSLEWSPHYFAEGKILIPPAEVEEPFKIWFDLESNNCRIDYYDGMTKTYQLYNNLNVGWYFKFYPFTNEITTNTEKCFKKINRKPIQSIVPDLTNFTLHSKNIEDGRMIEKWIHSTTEGGVDNKYRMFLFKKDNVIYPVRYEINGYNTLFNSHVDHYVIVYNNFSVIKPDPTIFQVKDYCKTIKESSTDHVYEFNPMEEFVQNYGQHVDSMFEEFKRHHNKNYVDGTREHFERKNNFRQNLRFIYSKNRANVGFKLDMNHFTDYSNEELTSRFTCRKENLKEDSVRNYSSFSQNDIKDLPNEINWWTAGAVNPVKDQSICGSCWSFSAVGVLEGAYFLKHGKRVRFSEQALIDCSWGLGNKGCDGGLEVKAYKWIQIHGIPTAEQYGPYLSQDGYCHIANFSNANLTKISNFVVLLDSNVEKLQSALVQYGPISVAIDAKPKSFKFYSNGIYYDKECDANRLNHVVLLVGYGTLYGEPYWLLKNSWSPIWGNDGYILMSRKDNMCGILSIPSYVIL